MSAAFIVTAPTSLLVVPTHNAFCVLMPPAVMIEPVVADVASVVRVDETPAAAVTRPLNVTEAAVNVPVRVGLALSTMLPVPVTALFRVMPP